MRVAETDSSQPGVAPEIAAIYADFLELAPEGVTAEATQIDGAGELLVSVFGTTTGVEAKLIESGELALAQRHRESIHEVLAERLKAVVREGGRAASRVSAAMDFEADAERLSFVFDEG